MKKLKIKKKYILLALVSLFIGYIGLRYYIKPDWFDSEHIYHKVYNLKVSQKKGLKKTIQDINIEFVHFDESKPVEGQWIESTRRDLKSDGNYTILHLSFTDKTKLDILFDRYNSGSLFKSDSFNYEQFNKLSLRFPGIGKGDGSEFRNYLMIYQGDTIYQKSGDQYVVTSFQLKIRKHRNFKHIMSMTLHLILIFFNRPIFYKISHIQQKNVKNFLMTINLMAKEIIGYEILIE